MYRWLHERSPDGAQRWWDAFLAALEKLREHPTGYGLAPEDEVFDEPLRQALFRTRRGNTYRLLFIVRKETVYILRVRGTGQDLLSSEEIPQPD